MVEPSNPSLKAAETYCKANGHRFTAPRSQVLSILLRASKPAGAYDIMAAMPKGTKPPTVYRALEFWEREGFIHRISSLSVYTACYAGHRHHGSQYVICDRCGHVEEVHLCHLPDALQNMIGRIGFKLTHWNAELHGLCRQCQTLA